MNDMIRYKNAKFSAYETEIDALKQKLFKTVTENDSLFTTVNSCKSDFKEKEAKSIDTEIVLEKKNKELENIICKLYQSSQVMHMLTKPQSFYDDVHKQALGYHNPFYGKKAQRMHPTLYDGNVLFNVHDVMHIADNEESLILAEESRLKMVEKQKENDAQKGLKVVKCIPPDYMELNILSTDLRKCFVPQQDLYAEQMFWLTNSDKNSEKPCTSNSSVNCEVPSELPKVSLVNESVKKLRLHLTKIDPVVKLRITPTFMTVCTL